AEADLGPESRLCLADESAGFLHGRGGRLDVLVRDVELRLEVVQNRVLKDFPPRSAVQCVVRLTGLPTVHLLVGLSRIECGAPVVRSYSTGGDERKQGRHTESGQEVHQFKDSLAAAGFACTGSCGPSDGCTDRPPGWCTESTTG